MNSEALSIRKVVIDSKRASIGTASDFSIQLPESIKIPTHYGVYCTDISCVHSFRTVHGNTSVGARNHYWYFWERNLSAFYPSENQYLVLNRATLSEGVFTPSQLAAELATQMNAVSMFGSNAYTR